MAEPIDQWHELTGALIRDRAPKLVENITRSNALMAHIQTNTKWPALTWRDRLRVWVATKRQTVGFWIAGVDPDDFDGW